MNRLELTPQTKAESVASGLEKDLARRIVALQGNCPVDMLAGFVRACRAQICGKCTPCRIGLKQIEDALNALLEGNGDETTVKNIRALAENARDASDCAIGSEAGKAVLTALDAFADDFTAHAEKKICGVQADKSVPCMAECPAHVNVPGYIALVKEGRYADAVRLIRRDNPFPFACAMICEHPCEKKCRRNLVDDAVNIRALKLSAVTKAGKVKAPACAPATGKKIAVIGGGPSGLTCAYFLQLMGHQCTVFEKRKQLGGMTVYGIPSYRLPRKALGRDIDCILSTGVEVKYGVNVGVDVTPDELRKTYDAVYISIGAHNDKKVGIEGEDAEGVLSAVEILGAIGDGVKPDFRGKTVCVIGGGNVAMDCTRSAIRLGASKVMTVYRRRVEDMTALPEEIADACAEGAEMRELCAPVRIETDESNKVTALWVSPKMIGKYDRNGRPAPTDSGLPDERIPCDIVLVAIGQGIDSAPFEAGGIPVSRGAVVAGKDCRIKGVDGVFAGGDCATGPATVIRAIAAGKTAAANIDAYLGYEHKIGADVAIPDAVAADIEPCGRVNVRQRPASDRKDDFVLTEIPLTDEETKQEAGRCLRCDQCGMGCMKKGGNGQW